jgi:hypothetical protein
LQSPILAEKRLLMSTQFRSRLRQEVELIQRFAGSYGRKFDALIAHLNVSPAAPADGQSVRLCVEAINMVLNLQEHLAGVLADLSCESAPTAGGVGRNLQPAA